MREAKTGMDSLSYIGSQGVLNIYICLTFYFEINFRQKLPNYTENSVCTFFTQIRLLTSYGITV